MTDETRSHWVGQSGPRLPPNRFLGIFVVAIVVILLIAVIIGLASGPGDPSPPCDPGAGECGAPPVGDTLPSPLPSSQPQVPLPAPSGAPLPAGEPVLNGTVWQSTKFGFTVVYDPARWKPSRQSDTDLVLTSVQTDATVLFESAAADELSPRQMIERRLAVVRKAAPDAIVDNDAYDAILGPHIGYVRAEGEAYFGHPTGSDGVPDSSAGYAIIAASDGRVTMGVMVRTSNPDGLLDEDTTRQALMWGRADRLLKTFDWGDES
jgi:hypothetical protein